MSTSTPSSVPRERHAGIAGGGFDDHLARPPKVVPLLATELPEISDQFKVWTVKLRPGVFFADDPAFKGKQREMVAEDFAYAFKRFADPINKSPAWSTLEDAKIIGLGALRQQALSSKKPFDSIQAERVAAALHREPHRQRPAGRCGA